MVSVRMSSPTEVINRCEMRLAQIWKDESVPAKLREYERRMWDYLRKSWDERDWAHNWDEHGLGRFGMMRIFEAYWDVRTMRLEAPKWTAEQYDLTDKQVTSELTTPEIKFYQALKSMLERLVPDPQWKAGEDVRAEPEAEEGRRNEA